MYNLIGLKQDSFSPDQVALNKDLLYDMNMGYVDIKSIRKGHGILHYESETEYTHPWEMGFIMEQFHFHQLHEFMTLTEYLTLPAFMVKKIIKGSSKGKADRLEYNAKKEEERRRIKEGQRINTANATMPIGDSNLAALMEAAAKDLKDQDY